MPSGNIDLMLSCVNIANYTQTINIQCKKGLDNLRNKQLTVLFISIMTNL
jgi:hypothetical protein